MKISYTVSIFLLLGMSVALPLAAAHAQSVTGTNPNTNQGAAPLIGGLNATGDSLPVGAGGTTVLNITGSTKEADFLGPVTAATTFAVTGDTTLSGNATVGKQLNLYGNLGIGLQGRSAQYPLQIIGPSGQLGTGGQAVIGTGQTWWAVDAMDGAGNWLAANASGKAWSAIGTQDNEPLYFSTNGQWVEALNANGSVIIGNNLAETSSAYTVTSNALGQTPYLLVEGDIYSAGAMHATAYYHSSDMRLKSDIRPIDHALDKLMAIHGVEFNWKADGRPDMGVVAQDVAKVFPNVVAQPTDGKGMMSVEYDSLAGPMIESIRELKMENDVMKAQLTEIRESLKALKEDNTRLRSINARGEDSLTKTSSVVEP